MSMAWEESAEGVLATLCRMVPETLRELAKSAARDESELVASERDSATVGIDDVVRGWIRTTPPEQRNSLVAVIEDLGLEPERYAEELESGEGWEEDEQTE
ncbi:MAG: DUF2621 family protein [Chloroflexi bacterium]|nr:MAG: DUF2621 family protein [Chloroflexota bacterium]TMF67445.1 MAG: DUF2621 family protein [Chloroflexota bacterium]TMG36373.1 MAG: DUF2621 family protein [Chloroflexota bacterium]TMG40352.1 MAG: DUF2621 family protein [Chloroflexota bacterium]